MNDVQHFIDRQLGIYSRNLYDNVLKRLIVEEKDSFRGVQASTIAPDFNPEPPIFACRFAELNGYESFLALANEDGRVAIQDTSRSIYDYQVPLEGFQCHNNAVFDLAWVPQQMKFVTVSGDHTACLWDLGESSPRKITVFACHTRSVKTAVFRPYNPTVFATGARDGHVLVWDVRTPQNFVVKKPDNSLMSCHSIFTPKTPASSSKRPQRPTDARATSITGLAFQDEHTLISCGECDGNIKVWDLRKSYTNCKKEPLPKHSIPYAGSSTKNGYTNLIMDNAKILLYASCMDNVIYCFNISTYSSLPEQRYIGHENGTFYIKTSLSPDNNYLVSGSSDKYAYIWNVKYCQPLVRLEGHTAEVTCASWCQSGHTKLVTCSDDARHMVWKIGKESLDDFEKKSLKGWAGLAPRKEILPLSQWLSLDLTPKSIKRKETPNSASAKKTCLRKDDSRSDSIRKTKRCLTDMLNAFKSDSFGESHPKRPKMEPNENSDPTGNKRKHDGFDIGNISPCKKLNLENDFDKEWSSPMKVGLGDSFITPTKYYKCISPRKISPKISPCRSSSGFNCLQNLPDFVKDGDAPHLRLMSPVKKREESSNWLLAITREKKGKFDPSENVHTVPLSPKIETPTRRNSTSSEKTPKQCMQKGSLLKYFNIIPTKRRKLE